MEIGYQVIEPDCLNTFIGNVEHFDFVVLLLSWIVTELASQDEFSDVELKVIAVNYQGSYPAIGARQETRDSALLDKQVNIAINRLLRTKHMSDFLDFSKSFTIRWLDIASDQ